MNEPLRMQRVYDLSGKRVWVAGHRGMVGSALCRRLSREPCTVITVDRADLDLRDAERVRDWLHHTRPDAVFMAAARVGGILANQQMPAAFLYDNLMIETAIIDGAQRAGVGKLMFLGSSCIYPKHAPQPIPEEALLTGSLEPTNDAYAVAKIAGLKLVEAYRREHGCDFISAMPCNLYGPGDRYDPQSSHVVPALLLKAHMARQEGVEDLTIWGTGTPRREFMHVDDCADGLVHLMQHWSGDDHVNLGVGADVSILELAQLIMNITGLRGRIITDDSKPDGTPRKLLSVSKMNALGWRPRISLEEGLRSVYAGPPFSA